MPKDPSSADYTCAAIVCLPQRLTLSEPPPDDADAPAYVTMVCAAVAFMAGSRGPLGAKLRGLADRYAEFHPAIPADDALAHYRSAMCDAEEFLDEHWPRIEATAAVMAAGGDIDRPVTPVEPDPWYDWLIHERASGSY